MKVLTLVTINLKRFIRNWRSVALLVGFPLLIVGAIFASFSPAQKQVPVGTIDNTEEFDYGEFKDRASSFAEIQKYNNTSECVRDIKKYKTYVCTVISKVEDKEQYEMRVYYDNTREVIDNTILSGIKSITNNMQIQYSRRRASRALSEVGNLTEDIRDARSDAQEIDKELKRETSRLDKKIIELRNTRRNLKSRLQEMDEDVNETEEDINDFNERRKKIYSNLDSNITLINTLLTTASAQTSGNIQEIEKSEKKVEDVENQLENYNEEIKNEIEQVNEMIENYREFRKQSRTYLAEINQTIKELNNTKRRLKNYRDRIQKVDKKLGTMESKYSKASEMEAGEIANFVKTRNNKVYNPEDSDANLLILQTIYSTLLMLVSLFVSILISKFVTLNHINSKARKRVSATPHTFISEYFSTYLTSMIIITIPLTCVLLFGQYFFKLPIIQNLSSTAIILALFCSTLVNLGITSAHLIRDESITLLIGSFIIVFMIFYSGFVLPIEMMSTIPRTIASIMPGNTATQAFDLTILYKQPISAAKSQLTSLTIWNIILTATALKTKKLRD